MFPKGQSKKFENLKSVKMLKINTLHNLQLANTGGFHLSKDIFALENLTLDGLMAECWRIGKPSADQLHGWCRSGVSAAATRYRSGLHVEETPIGWLWAVSPQC